MGFFKHEAIVVVTTSFRKSGLPDIEKFKETEVDSDLRGLVLGPIKSGINEFLIYAFLPDGSKEGWDMSFRADETRQRFLQLFDQSHDDVVHVVFGSDFEYEFGGPYIETPQQEHTLTPTAPKPMVAQHHDPSPYVEVGVGGLDTLRFYDSFTGNEDLDPITRAVIIARLRTLADLLEVEQ